MEAFFFLLKSAVTIYCSKLLIYFFTFILSILKSALVDFGPSIMLLDFQPNVIKPFRKKKKRHNKEKFLFLLKILFT